MPGFRILAWAGWALWLGATLSVALLTEPFQTIGGPWTLLFAISTLATSVFLLLWVPRKLRHWWRNRPMSDAQIARAEAELAGIMLRQIEPAIERNRWETPAPIVRRWHLYTSADTLQGSTTELDSLDVYKNRSLLITAPAGYGKTMLGMLLVRQWLRDRNDGEPVPVLIGLNGWDPRVAGIGQWLTVRIGQMFSGRYAYRKALNLVLKGRVRPVLDGADELIPAVWQAFVTAVSKAGPVVVIGREAFEIGADVLDLLALRDDDLVAHLELLTGAGADNPLAQTGSPLIIGLLHHHPDPAAFADRERFPDPGSAHEELLGLLVPVAFRGSKWDPAKAAGWLAFLAGHLNKLGTNDFAWWQLHLAIPEWMEDAEEYLNKSILSTAPSYLNLHPRGRIKSLLRWLIVGMAGAFVIGGTAVVPEAIKSIAGEIWGDNRSGIPGLIEVFAIIIGLAMLCVGLAGGLMRFAQEPEVLPMPWTPAESLRRDRRMARGQILILSSVIGASLGLAVGVLLVKDEGQIMGIFAGLAFAGPIGFLLGILTGIIVYWFGSTAGAIYLGIVRRLARRKQVPRNLMSFLDHAYGEGLLRQQGAVFQFRAPWLQERFSRH